LSSPSFAQVDFAVVREPGGTLVPKLIELQGFPSLTSLQVVQRDVWKDTLAKVDGLDVPWSCWFSGYDREAFVDLARRTIVGRHDPAEVILEAAGDFLADLIVVGSRGLTSHAHFILGSVAASVAHHAPCDVLVEHTTA